MRSSLLFLALFACDSQEAAETPAAEAPAADGKVIRGETDHYDYICQAVSKGLVDVALEHRMPVLFGVLTCATEEQALARSGGTHGNKGADAALDALRMIDVFKKAEESS